MSYEITLLTVMGLYVILAMSLNLITGFCGQISLGHAAFYGTGAYTAALFTTNGGDIWLGMLLSMAVAGAIGLVVGFTSLRVRDDFLAITTMGVGFLFLGIVRQQDALGGEIGISGVPDAGLGKLGYMILVVALAALATGYMVYIKRTWMGFAFRAIASNEDTARSVGIDVARFKLTAFVMGTGIAGLAGALYAHHVKIVGIDGFGFIESITILVMVIVGGIGSIWGVLVAAAVLSVMPLWLQFIADYKMLFYGVLLFLIMRFAPGGLDAIFRDVIRLLSNRRPGSESQGSLAIASPATNDNPAVVTELSPLTRAASESLDAPENPPPGSHEPHPIQFATDAASPSGGPLLRVDGVTVRFGGVVALDQVNFSVNEGELLGLIGPNGAGKTTMLNVVTGVVRPTHGRVELDGRDISRLPTHIRARLGLGLSHQIVRKFESMTALENVAIAAGGANISGTLRSLFRVSRDDALARAERLLELVGIPEAAGADVRELPLGYLKRLGVARALALEPRVLLLDEPLAGLNHVEANRMADTIRSLNRCGRTIVLIEHNLSEVMRICDRLVVLDNGHLLAEGAPQTVISNQSVRDAYMGTEGETVAAA